MAATIPQVGDYTLVVSNGIVQPQDMGIRKIANMDIVANASPVWSVIVGAKYLYFW